MAYWEEKLREMNPPKPGMMPFEDASAIFEKATKRTDEYRATGPVIGYENIVRGPWAPDTRSDVASAINAFRSDAFQKEYAGFRETVRRGWVAPPRTILEEFSNEYRSGLRSWATILLGYSRYFGETMHDSRERSEVWRESATSASQLERSRDFRSIMWAAYIRITLGNEITLAVQETDAATRIPLPIELLATPEELEAKPTDLVAGIVIQYRHKFDSMFVPDGGWMDVASAVKTSYGESVTRLWNVTSPVYYDRDETDAAFNDLLAALDECTSSGKLRARFGGRLRSFPNDKTPLMMLQDPLPWRFCQSLDWYYSGRTALEAAACTIALHNYRAEYGEYPVALDRLVPSELPRLPIDFGNGKTLTYRRTKVGYVLYSVGGDGVDDHVVTGTPTIERSVRIWWSVGADFPCSNFQRAKPR